MARKTPIDKLSSEIASLLEEYGDDVKESMDEAVKKVSKAGAKALRAESKQRFGGSGAYAKGWTSTVETGKRSAQGVIYNKDLPGLPHLLEHGHLNRDGSRTPGRLHIAIVEEQIIEEFEKEVYKGL
ncbi:MAG: hypothetical protein HFF04_00800 [Oscillospiraceae bacterium]|nr:hypothetical protein [Oscillospiraceae bacterium]